MIVLEVLGQIVFWLTMLVGIIVIPFGLPGTFIIVLNTMAYGWITGFVEVGWQVVGLLFVIAVLAEVLEFVVGAASAARYGASRPGMAGALVGGFLGAILGTPVFPVLGTLLGAFAGAFVGSAAVEFFVSKDMEKSLRVGFGAFLGVLGGRLTKIAAGAAMVVMVAFRIIG